MYAAFDVCKIMHQKNINLIPKRHLKSQILLCIELIFGHNVILNCVLYLNFNNYYKFTYINTFMGLYDPNIVECIIHKIK